LPDDALPLIMTRIMTAGFKNILIIKPSSLGDIVLGLPALSALRRSFPDARISWLVRPEFAQLLKNHPYLNEVVLFDRRFLGKALFNPRALNSLIALVRRLRKSKFDAVIDLQGLFRTACLAWLSGCHRRFGMTTAREFATVFYTDKVQRSADSIHVVDYYQKVIACAGASILDVEFKLPVSEQAACRAAGLLSGNKIDVNNYAVFVPGSVHKSKCWPAENFVSLAKKITSQFGLSVITVGTKSDKAITERIVSETNGQVTDFAGLTSLPELAALLKGARIVVSNDTGPGHMAAALGVRLVMIFGPSNPVRLFPYRRPETLAAVEPFGRGPELQSSDPAHVIEAVTVEMVYQKVTEQLGS
jgi:heptosyltransferase-1